MASVFGAGHHQREVQRHHAAITQQFGHIAFDDFLREPFHNGGLAHTGFAEQHGIVLRATTENLDDPLDFVFAADHRIHLALAGNLREVAAEGAERGGFGALLAAFGRSGFAGLFHFILAHGEVGIEFLENFLACLLDVDVQIFQHARRHAFAFAQKAE